MKTLALPNIADPPEVQADWLEWSALSETASFVSWTAYQGNLTQAGSDDAIEIEQDQDEEDVLEDLINEVDRELQSRRNACGGRTGFYPYEMTHDGIAYSGNRNDLTYRFLLLLSLFGKDAGPQRSYPERLFEEPCSLALHQYMGGVQAGLERAVFGFPRKVLPPHFPKALDDLCQRMGEGVGSAGRVPASKARSGGLARVSRRPPRKVDRIRAMRHRR